MATFPWTKLHDQLMQFIPKLDNPAEKSLAKIQLMGAVSELMPQGKPDYLGVVKYPMVKDLAVQMGAGNMLLMLSAIVRDFCASVNVSRNMNGDQIVEAAAMLLDECGNFRLEDYVMMFTLAKRGELVKIYERVDLSVITEIMDRYWERRRDAAEEAQVKEAQVLETLGPVAKHSESGNAQDMQIGKLVDGLAGAFSGLKQIVRNGE